MPLAASAPDFGSRREFSFTLDGDIYIRYLSFLDAKAWQAECMKKLPHKMDMGAVYTAPVSHLDVDRRTSDCWFFAAQGSQFHQGERVQACGA